MPASLPVAGLMLVTVFAISGCASVTRNSTELLGIHSEPSGASVRSSTGWDCITPCEIEVERRSQFALDVELPGYKTARVLVEARIDGGGKAGMAGNILLGGVIGAIIDGSTGAMYSHGENPILVLLEPEGIAGGAPQ